MCETSNWIRWKQQGCTESPQFPPVLAPVIFEKKSTVITTGKSDPLQMDTKSDHITTAHLHTWGNYAASGVIVRACKGERHILCNIYCQDFHSSLEMVENYFPHITPKYPPLNLTKTSCKEILNENFTAKLGILI